MFKEKLKLIIQENKEIQEKGLLILNDRSALALIGGCERLRKCGTFTDPPCPRLKTCGEYIEL